MTTKLYRIALLALLFGLSPLGYAGDYTNPLLAALTNVSPLISLLVFVLCYFSFPGIYKVIAWVIMLSVILLVLESKYEYDKFIYSYFVIKRFAYCGVALTAYYVVSKAGFLKIEYAVYITLGLFFFYQILLGQIFSYTLTSDTRTTFSTDAYFLLLPFLYYLVLYLKARRLVHLLASLCTLLFIIFLLHRTVISAAVVAAVVMFGLAFLGKVTTGNLPIGRTLVTFGLILAMAAPFTDLLPESKVDSFMQSISGIFFPKEDNTGSWRVEQSEFYLGKVPERPLFGWRYTGYDRGEIMENEDFPDKGTIIHSQYIDMLYNYGAFGLIINIVLMLSTLIALYRSSRTLSTDQLVLFGFVAGGLIFGITYQIPVYYWAFVGVGMYYGLKPPVLYIAQDGPVAHEDTDGFDSSPTITLSNRLNPHSHD